MKGEIMKRIYLVAVLAICVCFITNVQAAESPWYIGVKAGQMMLDADDAGDATNAGLVAGYRLSEGDFGTFAIEGEFTTAISKGDITILGVPCDWDVVTVAMYGVYRSAGDVYFKGKIGVLNEDATISVAGNSVSESDSGTSFGIGGGFRVGQSGSLEVEYTIIEEDIDFLSIGYSCNF